jgi:putative transposase
MALRFRKHIRLPDHDYTQGAYFVTLCTRSRLQVLGRIEGSASDVRVELTDVGRIVYECWRAIPDHFPHVHLDEMQIMPDHLHAILVLDRRSGHGTVGATRWVAATTGALDNMDHGPDGLRRGSLGAIIGAFKSETTKRVNRMNATLGQRLWQPNYHERVIRENHGERERIARYIAENPTNWR